MSTPGVRGWGPAVSHLAAAVVPPVLALLALLGIWQVVSNGGWVPSDMLPEPTRILSSGFAERDALLRNTIPTLLATLAGFALSVTVAFVTATLLDFST